MTTTAVTTALSVAVASDVWRNIPTANTADSDNSTRHHDGTYMRRAFASYTPSDFRIVENKKSTGFLKWTDTSIGGNYAINTPYQFTSFADIPAQQLAPVGFGMGRFYSEVIDDNRHDIHMRFGIQEFNSFAGFFLRWFDYSSAKIARTGRAPGFLYSLGNIIGLGLGWIMPMSLIAAHTLQFALATDSQAFWNIRPMMHLYWKMVNQLAQTVAANMALSVDLNEDEFKKYASKLKTSEVKNLSDRDTSGVYNPITEKMSSMDTLTELMPDIWRKTTNFGNSGQSFTLDVMAVATRAQRYFNLFHSNLEKRLSDQLASKNLNDLYQVSDVMVESAFADLSAKRNDFEKPNKIGDKGGTLDNYLKAFYDLHQGKTELNANGRSDDLMAYENNSNAPRDETAIDPDSRYGYYGGEGGGKPDDGIFSHMLAELYNGSGWVTFRVNGKGSVNESFSNSEGESAIAGAINTAAKTKETLRFNMAGGNIFGAGVKAALDGAQDVLMGVAKQFGLEGLIGGLFSGSNVDIAKTWSDSSYTPAKLSYTLPLNTPYGHPVCVYQDLYLPLFCLLAGTAAISHGPAAYGSPLYVELYDKGRCQIKRGLIGDLNITRGTGNVPWSPITGLPTAIDISFSVTDLSAALHIPINTETSILDLLSPGSLVKKVLIGPDGALDDYMSVLSSLGVHDQIYNSRKVKRNLMTVMRQWQTTFSAANFATWVGNSAVGEMAKNLVSLKYELRR